MDINTALSAEAEIAVRRPKRILHFSDGTMEEFSDEEDDVDACKSLAQVDESQLDWISWFIHKSYKTGYSVLAGCDYLGETLASILGITTPKYQSEIEEFKRNQEQQQKEEAENLSGWIEIKDLKNSNDQNQNVIDKEKY